MQIMSIEEALWKTNKDRIAQCLLRRWIYGRDRLVWINSCSPVAPIICPQRLRKEFKYLHKRRRKPFSFPTINQILEVFLPDIPTNPGKITNSVHSPSIINYVNIRVNRFQYLVSDHYSNAKSNSFSPPRLVGPKITTTEASLHLISPFGFIKSTNDISRDLVFPPEKYFSFLGYLLFL